MGYVSREEADKRAAEANEGGDFLKLKDGESVLLVFIGEPWARTLFWDGSKSVPYTEQAYAAAVLANPTGTKSPKVRFPMSAWKCVKQELVIADLAASTYEDMRRVENKFGDGCVIDMTRNGTGLDTKYSFLPGFTDGKLAVSNLPEGTAGHDFAQIFGDAPAGGFEDASNNDIRITEDEALDIMAELKAIPMPDALKIMKDVGAERVSQLTGAQAAKVRAAMAPGVLHDSELPF